MSSGISAGITISTPSGPIAVGWDWTDGQYSEPYVYAPHDFGDALAALRAGAEALLSQEERERWVELLTRYPAEWHRVPLSSRRQIADAFAHRCRRCSPSGDRP